MARELGLQDLYTLQIWLLNGTLSGQVRATTSPSRYAPVVLGLSLSQRPSSRFHPVRAVVASESRRGTWVWLNVCRGPRLERALRKSALTELLELHLCHHRLPPVCKFASVWYKVTPRDIELTGFGAALPVSLSSIEVNAACSIPSYNAKHGSFSALFGVTGGVARMSGSSSANKGPR
jgi:hypothetical protein